MAPEGRPLPGRRPEAASGAGSQLPQAIAHRGYNAAYPENTMAAFRGAVSVGAHAIETDLHLSKDDVVVLSHDATLQRCYGTKKKVADCDWSYLGTLKTTRPPHEPMPRLQDLLEYLAQPGLDDIWILLDIKRDDDPDRLLKRAAAVFDSVPTSRAWKDRVVLGCWNLPYINVCREHLPGFATAYIGWSLPYATKLLREPGVHFNLLQQILVGPWGTRFVAAAREARRRVFVWTVNKEDWMEWSIRKGVDGVITDDPELFLRVCDRWGDEDDASSSSSVCRAKKKAAATGRQRAGVARRLGMMVQVAGIQVLTLLMTALLLYNNRVMARRQRRKRRS